MNFNSKIIQILSVFILVFFSCQSEQPIKGFKTEGTQLLDAKGNAFVMRGVNMPHAWHPQKSYQALNYAANHQVNCVRIVWESHLPAQGLDSILQKCISLKMIPMLELHDATGDATDTKLFKMLAYFTSVDMQAIIKKYEKYILINIANEWGNNELTPEYWRDAYKKCISQLRSSGYQSTIVIDAPGWGQNSEPILSYAQELIEFDSLHNLLFSIHMYGSWNNEAKIEKDLKEANHLSIPIIVGEFGYNYNKGDNNLNCKVNHQKILQVCTDLDIGYLAWSWTGNNEENKWLDLAENSDWKTLTRWGKEIIKSPLGIEETAKKASVF